MDLLSRIFIKNRENTADPAVRRAYGTMASIVGVIANLILFSGKLTVGTISGAISITADAFNNLSDAGSQIISLVSFKISAKPADREHPFGHARIEYVASMIVSFLVLLVGYELFSESVAKLINPEPPSREKWIVTVLVLAASVFAKFWLGLFNHKLGKKINSTVMKATAADSLSDSLATTAVLAGMIIYLIYGWVRVDAIMGVAVSVVIFIAGVKILNETKNSILGEAPSDEIVEGIHNIVVKYPGALGIHDMVIHNYGPGRVIASLHVEVDGKDDIFELHEMIDDIEKQISGDLSIEATIHMDPIVTDDEKVNELRNMTREIVKRLDERMKIHDFRCVIGKLHTNLIFDVAVPFEVQLSDIELCDVITDKIHDFSQEYNTVITIDRE